MEKTPKMILPSHIERELSDYMATGISDYSKLIAGLQKGEYIMRPLNECRGTKGKGKGKGKGK